MTKHTVLKDIMHETVGTPSKVGMEVDSLVFLPANHKITISDGDNLYLTFVNKGVYLCRGPGSRMLDKRYGKEKEVVITAILGEKAYSGNDLYSAEELGLEE